eukprot:TRINITY_DN652_c0_g1_i2.p1 TRINITY_DN652_c0_g1~~TRINITY_DN652_c0_g1_i2.p1  ORF type:complete len:328 (-),score=66.85 TRINITY_DN652_c0_g1_i2:28-939(-)
MRSNNRTSTVYVQRWNLASTGSEDDATTNASSGSEAEPCTLLQEWTCEQVVQWLRNLGSDYYQAARKFQRSGIDGYMLLALTPKEMKELGIKRNVHLRRVQMAISKQLELEEESDDEELTYVIPLKEEKVPKGRPSLPALSISSSSDVGDDRLDAIELGYALAKHELPKCGNFAMFLLHLNQNISPKLDRDEKKYLRQLFDKDQEHQRFPQGPGINGMNNSFGNNGFSGANVMNGYGMNGYNAMGMQQSNFDRQVQQMERQWERQKHEEEKKRIGRDDRQETEKDEKRKSNRTRRRTDYVLEN